MVTDGALPRCGGHCERRLASKTSGRGITETYTYDDLDRVLEIDYSDTTVDVTYTYDAAGQVDTRTDASGVTSYDYDPLGRLTTRTHTAGGAVAYSYDKAGNLATATNAAGTATYSYDVRNLVTAITPADGRRITFAHDADGRRTDTWFNVGPGGYDGTTFAAHSHTDYDPSGRIARTWTSRNGNDGLRVSDLSYTYTAAGSAVCPGSIKPAGADTGLRHTMTDHLTGATTQYCYDAANRLTSATTPGGDTWRYTYDKNGNRTLATKNGVVVRSLAVNSADQITSAGHAHDASGNQTEGTGFGIGTATYNGAEQMVARQPASTVAAYTYAGTDQTELITEQPTGGAPLRTYTYGRTNANGMPIVESYSTGSTYSYLYDPQGTPLAVQGGNSHYLATDGLGSPVALINHTGTQTGAYAYDPYGGTTATAVGGSSAIGIQIYGYAGGIRDTSSPLMHYGQRWYNPATGRFTQQDSLETLLDPSRSNRYEYAASNPINYIDPTGMAPTFWQRVGAKVAGAAAGLVGAVVGAAVGTVILPGPGTIAGGYVGGGCASQVVEDGVLANVNGTNFGGREALQSCALGLIS